MEGQTSTILASVKLRNKGINVASMKLIAHFQIYIPIPIKFLPQWKQTRLVYDDLNKLKWVLHEVLRRIKVIGVKYICF